MAQDRTKALSTLGISWHALSGRTTSLGSRFAIALTAMSLAFGAQIGIWLGPDNAYHAMWSGRDALAIILDIVVGAAVAVAGYELLRWLCASRLLQLYRHLFLLLVLGSLLSLLSLHLHPARYPNRNALAWLLVVGATAYSLGRARCTLVYHVSTLCLILSPLAPILFFQLATLSCWSSSSETLPRVTPRSNSHPVFVFVFDAWSYHLSTSSDTFISELPNLRALCQQSTFFRNASSPGPCTHSSMPRLLFGCSDELVIRRGTTYWLHGDQLIPTADCPSLFVEPREQGYRTCMVGWYIPYRNLLGNQVDYCCSWPELAKGETLPGKMVFSALWNIKCFNGPASQRAWELYDRVLEAPYAFARGNAIRRETLNILGDDPGRIFGVFHWSIPHPPFVFQSDGSFRSRPRGLHEVGYDQQLLYMDAAVGEVVNELQTRGLFDSCLLIMTSDHNVPDLPEDPERLHVPLLVKWPGQQTGRFSERNISTLEMRRWIRQAIQGEPEEAFAAAWTSTDGAIGSDARQDCE